jgi:hypothetical protein
LNAGIYRSCPHKTAFWAITGLIAGAVFGLLPRTLRGIYCRIYRQNWMSSMMYVRRNPEIANSADTSLAGSSSESVGKQVCESTLIPPSDKLKRRPPAFWMIIGLLILINLWYDYYHPLGLIFDLIIAVGIFVGYARRLWDIRHSQPGMRSRKQGSREQISSGVGI